MIKRITAAATCIALALCLCGCGPTYKGMAHDIISQCQTEKSEAHIEVTGYLSQYSLAKYDASTNKVHFLMYASDGSLSESVSVFINNGSEDMAAEINKKSKSKPITVSGTLSPTSTTAHSITVVGASVL